MRAVSPGQLRHTIYERLICWSSLHRDGCLFCKGAAAFFLTSMSRVHLSYQGAGPKLQSEAGNRALQQSEEGLPTLMLHSPEQCSEPVCPVRKAVIFCHSREWWACTDIEECVDQPGSDWMTALSPSSLSYRILRNWRVLRLSFR